MEEKIKKILDHYLSNQYTEDWQIEGATKKIMELFEEKK